MRPLWRHYWAAVVLLAAAAPLPAYVTARREVPLRRPLSELSYQLGQWHSRDQQITERTLNVLKADDVLLREYVSGDGQPIWLYVSFFARQRRGEVTHSPKHCLPGAGWQPRASRRVPYPAPSTRKEMINEILYEKPGQQQLVYYWFQERGRIVASEYAVKWHLILDAIVSGRSDGALVRVSSPVLESEEATRRRCLGFMQAVLPQLNEFFPVD